MSTGLVERPVRGPTAWRLHFVPLDEMGKLRDIQKAMKADIPVAGGRPWARDEEEARPKRGGGGRRGKLGGGGRPGGGAGGKPAGAGGNRRRKPRKSSA